MARPFDPNSIRQPRRSVAYRRPASSYRRSTFDMIDNLQVVFFGLVILFMVGIFGTYVYSVTQTDTVTCTVVDKDRTYTQNGSDMRVYTEDCGTLRVADSLFDTTWSSSDTYASIEPGNTYTFDTRGIRVPLFSMFPNIVEVHD